MGSRFERLDVQEQVLGADAGREAVVEEQSRGICVAPPIADENLQCRSADPDCRKPLRPARRPPASAPLIAVILSGFRARSPQGLAIIVAVPPLRHGVSLTCTV